MSQDPIAQIEFRRRPGALGPLMWVAGLIATALAVTVGAVLAVFTAAAVAVIAVSAGVLMFLTGLAVRARRRLGGRGRRAGDAVIDAHKVGDTWVAYGWERPGR